MAEASYRVAMRLKSFNLLAQIDRGFHGVVSLPDRSAFVVPSRSFPTAATGSSPFAPWLFEILARREIAREHWLLDEFLGIICPKLAHLRIGLDNCVGEFAI